MSDSFKQIVASVLLVSLLLQSCYNPNGLITRKNNAPDPVDATGLLPALQSDPEDEDLPGTALTLAPLQPNNKVAQDNELVLSEQLSSIERKDIASTISTLPPATKESLTNNSATQPPNNAAARAQQPISLARHNQIVVKPLPPQHQCKQEFFLQKTTPLTTNIPSLVQADGNTSDINLSRRTQPLIAKGGERVTFAQLPTGQWQAIVVENPLPGLSRKLVLPVYLTPGESIEQVYAHTTAWQQRNVHVIWQQGKGCVYVGSVGLLGGMFHKLGVLFGLVEVDLPKEEDANTERMKGLDLNRLFGKLQYLYAQDNKLPKLIEDEDIPAQRLDDYYVKLQIVVQEDINETANAAAKDSVVGEKKPIALEQIFDSLEEKKEKVSKNENKATVQQEGREVRQEKEELIPKSKEQEEKNTEEPAKRVGRILLLGGAGIGKSTLMHYVSYQWANGNLWNDKYEHVFRVRLKEMLNGNWSNAYTREEQNDLLACFIHSCLDTQKTTLLTRLKTVEKERLRGVAYTLLEIKQLLKDPTKKDRVLLLVDGYDEVTSMKGTPAYQKILDLGVFEHPQVIMTSRPNAASSEIRGKFERQIESQGLDEVGIQRYIDLYFNAPHQQAPNHSLKTFLACNNQLMNMCEVPINTALMCIIWQDPTVRARFTQNLSSQEELKLGQLYHELIMWLGKRYTTKHNPSYINNNSPTALRELSEKAILDNKVFKALVRVAYETFTNKTGKEGGALGIPGHLLDELAKKENNDLQISDLQNYGLVRGEGDPNKPLEQTYYFIHLTFQEYLTAYQLCKLLSQEDQAQVQKVATWIAHHRNDPKYLMTLKFLAGLVSQSRDELLVKRFWETVSCNVDGVLELGLEGKVHLLMHLLGQSQVGGKSDTRIPNLPIMQRLIDEVVLKDLVQWQQTIIESGYISEELTKKVKNILDQAGEQQDENLLRAAANIATAMVNKGTFGTKVVLLDKFMSFTNQASWRLQKLGLEQASQVVGKYMNDQKLVKVTEELMELLSDENLGEAAIGLLAKLGQIYPISMVEYLLTLVKTPNDQVTSILSPIIKNLPQEEVRKVCSLLFTLLKDENCRVSESAASVLSVVVLMLPKEERLARLHLLNHLLEDMNGVTRNNVVKVLIAIITTLPKEETHMVLHSLDSLLENEKFYIRCDAVYALGKIIPILQKEEVQQDKLEATLHLLIPMLKDKHFAGYDTVVQTLVVIAKISSPEKLKKILNLLKSILVDKEDFARYNAAKALKEVILILPQEKIPTTWSLLKPLFKDKQGAVRAVAADALGAIASTLPKEEAQTALHLLFPLLRDEDPLIRKPTILTLGTMVPNVPKEKIQTMWDLLKPLLSDTESDVRKNAVDVLGEMIKFFLKKTEWNLTSPALTDEAWQIFRGGSPSGAITKTLLKEVSLFFLISLVDNDWDVRRSTANALKEIAKILPEAVLSLFNLLLSDQEFAIRYSIAKALRVVALNLPKEKMQVVWNLLKPLLRDGDGDIRTNATKTLEKIIPVLPKEEVSVAWNLLKLLLNDEWVNVRKYAVSILYAIIPILPKEEIPVVWNLLTPLLNDKDSYIRGRAAFALGAIVPILANEEKQTALNLLGSLLNDKDSWVCFYAVVALGKIVPTLPEETIQTAWDLLQPLLKDERDYFDYHVLDGAVYASEQMALILPKKEISVMWKLLKPLLRSRWYYVRRGAVVALGGIASALSKEEMQAALTLLAPLLHDKESSIRKVAAMVLESMVNNLSLAEIARISSDAPHQNLRKMAKEALVNKFKADEGAKLSYKEVDLLIKIMTANKGREALEEDLYKGANKVLHHIAENINHNGVQWIREHISALPNVPEVQSFLKSILHKTLRNGVIDEEEAQLVIKCIVERGIAVTIDPQANKIFLEHVNYQLDHSSKEVLEYIADEVIKSSQDIVAQRYRAHKPLFANNGIALPVAVADIPQIGSIVNNATLQSGQWQLSVMDLSDHHQNTPGKTFLLLEQRKYAGDHSIYQITMENNYPTVHSYVVHPHQLDTVLREKIFGNMEYDFAKLIKPRYHGASFTISQEKGEELLSACNQSNLVQLSTDHYKHLHSLAAGYITGGDKLNISWEAYRQEPFVKMYKKDALLRIEGAQVRRDSMDMEQREKARKQEEQTHSINKQVTQQGQQLQAQGQQLQKHEEQINLLNKTLEISGVKGDAAIRDQLEKYKATKPELFNYCTTFIWTIKNYLDAYAVASSGLVATNQESSTAEKVGMFVGKKVVGMGLGFIPVVSDFADLLLDGIDAVRDHVKSAKQGNKIAVINELLHRDHTLPSDVERSIAQAALEIAKRKEASIVTPAVESKGKLSKLATSINEKFNKLTDKLVQNYHLSKSPQAELAVQDVVLLMAKLYTQYETLKANRSAELYKQIAAFICEGSLVDMIATSLSAARTINLSEAEKAFSAKELVNFKKKSSQGKWEEYRDLKPNLHKGCKQYFEGEYIIQHLQQAQVSITEESIVASQIVLLKVMTEGIEAAKDLQVASKCAAAFGQKYPVLTELIARTYPEYFRTKAIAERYDRSLLGLDGIKKLP